jgi:hypothetical protein
MVIVRTIGRKVLPKAVKDSEMFGSFFISNPDFEFGNFTRDELVSVLWRIALERGADPNEEETLSKACSQPRPEKNSLRPREKRFLLYKVSVRARPGVRG